MIDSRKVKIYVLKDPKTLEVRYVGKTVRKLCQRLGNHIYNAKKTKHNKHLSNWILKILTEGNRPIIELIEECDFSIWQEREKFWISQYKNLINLTIGGDGCEGFLHNEETKIKCSLANKGRKHTDEFKQNMSKRLKGKPHSLEHKMKIAAANKGRKASEETIKKLRESHRGKIQSEETKKKRSSSIKLWWKKRKEGGSTEDIVKS